MSPGRNERDELLFQENESTSGKCVELAGPLNRCLTMCRYYIGIRIDIISILYRPSPDDGAIKMFYVMNFIFRENSHLPHL